MADDIRNEDGTDLIDVGDVSTQYEEVTAQPRRGPVVDDDAFSEPTVEAERPRGLFVASMKDRIASVIVDFSLLYVVYWFMMIAYRSIALEETAGPVPVAGIHGIIFNGLFLLVALLYYVLFEMLFFATPGKLLCRLKVRRTDGGMPGIASCLVRNLSRPVDLFLAPIAVLFALMEWTKKHQRLGDLISRTMIVRTHASSRRAYSFDAEKLPTATGRLLAFLIDFALFLVFVIGYCLLLTPERPVTSMLLVVFLPVVCALFFFVPEATVKTSMGKWLLGYVICNENGASIGASGAIIRTFFRPFDMNPYGYISIMCSSKRQRPGDTAADTLVIKSIREWKALIGIAALVAVVLIVGYSGKMNRTNFLSESFHVNFLPAFGKTAAQATKGGAGAFIVSDFRFAAGRPEDTRAPASFQPGEKVFLIFSVNGGKQDKGKYWVQEDLTVRYPDGSTGLKLENIIDFHEALTEPGPIELMNNIALPKDAMLGRYTVSIVLRDKNSGKQLNEQRFFYVSPSKPLTAAPNIEPPLPSQPTAPETPPASEPVIVQPAPQ